MLRRTLVFATLAAGVAGWQRHVNVTTRDGFNLSTYINCNDALGAPLAGRKVVFETSPYGHDGSELLADVMAEALGPEWCSVRQDLRGSGYSQGMDFTLWRSTPNDTFDTFSWIQKQDWASGEIYQTGVSADGIAAIFSTEELPPGLKKQYVVWATGKGHEMAYPGGAYREGLIDGWLGGNFPDQKNRLIHTTKQNEAPGEWWNPVNISNKCSQTAKYPAVLNAGWYDIFLQGNIDALPCYNSEGQQTRLVIEPCGHCLGQACPIYLLEDTNNTIGTVMALDLFTDRNPPPQLRVITFYVMGAGNEDGTAIDPNAPGNYWTTMDKFPAPRPTRYYFTRNGTLSTDAPTAGSSTARRFVYNPHNPVRTHGGNNLLLRCGALNQAESEKRDDVLLFTSPVLQEDVAVTGELVVTVAVSSNCTDTDFTAKLTDVHPSGKSVLLQDGIVRMRWRAGVTGGTEPQLLTPGKRYEVEISLWATSYIFPKGHRIRVAVSSSNSPRFLPNPNNGLSLLQEGPVRVAENTVFVDDSSSYITLPVVQKSQLPPVDVPRLLDDWLAHRPASYREKLSSLQGYKGFRPSPQ